MRSRLIYVLLFLIAPGGYILTSAQTASFDEQVTSSCNVRLNVSNVGTFGNAFRGYRDGTDQTSCEYPTGSGIEHLFESGIWIGGKIAGNVTSVSTAAYDAPQGYSTGAAGFEFTAETGSALQKRSSLFDSPFFNPQAVSHEDFVAEFSDKNLKVPGTNIDITDHLNPLNVNVHMETYNWNYSFGDFFVILSFEITNDGQEVIDSTYIGLWANTVIRNINVTPAGSGGSAFYNKGGNGYIDSLQLAYCFDAAGDLGFTESYVGQKFLGAEDKFGFHHPKIQENFDSHYNTWQFNSSANPVFFFPSSEEERYVKMTAGLNKDQCWDENSTTNQNCGAKSIREQIREAGNRSDLVSVGPFRDFAPGDAIKVAFAFVLAKKNEDGKPNVEDNEVQRRILMENADWAQITYNGEDVNFNGILDEDEDNNGDGILTRFILPSPPDIPRTRLVTGTNSLDIYWSDNSERSVDPITQEMDFEGYRVYLTNLGFDVTKTPDLANDLKRIAQYDIPSNGISFETGFESIRLPEPVNFPGDTVDYYYKYSIENIQNGWQYAVAVTAFDRGNPESNLESLESSVLSNNFRSFSGTPVNDDMDENNPFVYPNPYYAGASWEGKSNFQEQSRKIIFANLPERCRIRIFTTAGDLIDNFEHNAEYNGSDIRWFETFGAENAERNVFSGGEHAWDLLSEESQIIARGLYLFTVEDLETNKRYEGKFLIIK